MIRVQTAPIDIAAAYAALPQQADIGGIGCFIGRVRGDDGLLALTLEHYPGMTEQAMHRIAEAAAARWPLAAVSLIHRVGRLVVGEPIVLVLAAAAHRGAALAATGFLIDWLKTDAPFWKQESLADGRTRWVAAAASDGAVRAGWAAAEPDPSGQDAGQTISARGGDAGAGESGQELGRA